MNKYSKKEVDRAANQVSQQLYRKQQNTKKKGWAVQPERQAKRTEAAFKNKNWKERTTHYQQESILPGVIALARPAPFILGTGQWGNNPAKF